MHRISEIFDSIQGEGPLQGLPTTFVRTVGCPLRCVWCDSEYAFSGGTRMEFAEIAARIDAAKLGSICITGGEPLASASGYQLVEEICARFDQSVVSIETSGAFDTAPLPRRVVRVVDWKAESSGEGGTFLPTILDDLTARDAIKFVVYEDDLPWLEELYHRQLYALDAQLYVHPVHGETNLQRIADWLVQKRLPLRFGHQLHKQIWPDIDRGV